MLNRQTERVSLLLLEDSPADVFLVREAMREEGLDVDLALAEDGETAIRMIESIDARAASAPSVMLLDLNVPRKSGNQVLERLRQSPLCANIPVVMISSSDSPHERQKAMQLGATEYFHKPSTLAEFMELGKVVRRLHQSRVAV